MKLELSSWLPCPAGSEFLEQPPAFKVHMARVNQPPWLHQLAVPSTGWATVLHPVPHTALTNIGAQSNLFSCWPLTFVLSRYFPNLTLPSHLASYLPIYQPTFLTACIPTHPPSYLPLTQCQHSSMDITIHKYCIELYDLDFIRLHPLSTI
jgi:hypothetical protein